MQRASKALHNKVVQLFTDVHILAEHLPNNTALPALIVPKVVCMGVESKGKSSLANCLIGAPFSFVKDGTTGTRFPIVLNIVPLREASRPGSAAAAAPAGGVWSVIEPRGGPVQTSCAEVAAWLTAHTATFATVSEKEVIVRAELPDAEIAITFVDLPGFRPGGENAEMSAKIMEIARSYVKPENLIITVESAENPDISVQETIRLLRACSHPIDRVVRVHSRADQFIPGWLTLDVCQRRLCAPAQDGQPWFCAFPDVTRPGVSDDIRTGLKQWIERADRQLKAQLMTVLQGTGSEHLAARVGVSAVIDHVNEQIYKLYVEQLPRLKEHLLVMNQELQTTQVRLERAIACSSPYAFQRLRELTAAKWMNALRHILGGSESRLGSVDRPSSHALRVTLAEEHASVAASGLFDPSDFPSKVYPWDLILARKLNIHAFWEQPASGGARYLRVFHEFELYFLALEFPELKPYEISEIKNAPGIAHAVNTWTDTVHHLIVAKVAQLFRPLVRLLMHRLETALLAMCEVIEVVLLNDSEIAAFLASEPRILAGLRHAYGELVTRLLQGNDKRLEEFIQCSAERIRYHVPDIPQIQRHSELICTEQADPDDATLERIAIELRNWSFFRNSGAESQSKLEVYLDEAYADKSRMDAVTSQVHKQCALHFSSIRSHLAQQMYIVFNAFITLPLLKGPENLYLPLLRTEPLMEQAEASLHDNFERIEVERRQCDNVMSQVARLRDRAEALWKEAC